MCQDCDPIQVFIKTAAISEKLKDAIKGKRYESITGIRESRHRKQRPGKRDTPRITENPMAAVEKRLWLTVRGD